ncbi:MULTISPECIES: twin-arginine translocation signal domain-containing protein [unclassified Streptomyces]|uniref:twin-arginine translocation signal domain-containing protein n=1 Tax=unclassified Streptomyces TaxID=2593676 RepID=UPI0033A78C9D
MADRDLTRRRVLALSGAAVGAALGIGLSSCSTKAPEPGAHPGSGSTDAPGPARKSGSGSTEGPGPAGRSGPEGQDAR